MPSDTGWFLASGFGVVFLLKVYKVRVITVSILSSQGFHFLPVSELVPNTAFCLCPLQKSRRAHPAKQSKRPWPGRVLLLRAAAVSRAARYTPRHSNELRVACGWLQGLKQSSE